MNTNLFNTAWIADPKYFAVNRLPAHSSHAFYKTQKEAKNRKTSFKESLSGIWKFHYANNLSEVIDGFEAQDYNCSGWESMRVPAHIQLEGYDRPQYVNVQYPWDGVNKIIPGEILQEYNPVGSYVRHFTASADWDKTFISFQGVESAFAIWLNGSFVGYSEDSFTPSEFDLTPFIIDGKNKLAVQVYRFSSGSWLEDQDFWRLSGIFREVYLYTTPKTHISDMFIKTILDDDYRDALLSVSLTLTGHLEGNISARLYDKDLKEAAQMQAPIADGLVQLKANVFAPLLWSAEQPNLYHLTIEVLDRDGKLVETVEQRVGFRRFELKDGLMMLNGKRIVFHGVNRHEFNCRTGRAVTYEDMLADVTTMKRNNINAVRTSHYPNQPVFYDLCDEFGIYMIDETNLETHGTWQREGKVLPDENTLPKDRTDWHDIVLDRAQSMLQRDKNHPSILIWSCGNESFGGENLYKMSQFFREHDETRLVHYEGVFNDRSYNATSDMESRMYPKADEIAAFLQKDRTKPYICCEYSHAMGNSIGGLFKYTDLTKTEPLYQGGFIWDFIDQALVKCDGHGNEYLAMGGDFGDRPTDYNFCVNGLVFADREPTPKLQEVKFCYQNFELLPSQDGIKLINRSLFTNISEFKLVIELFHDGVSVKKHRTSADVPAGETETISLPFSLPHECGEYAINASLILNQDTAWAAKDYEIAFGQYVYDIAKPAEIPTGSVNVVHGDVNIGVSGAGFSVQFIKSKGILSSYNYAGTEYIEGIPMPNFWRAPTDNDEGYGMAMHCAQWKLASLYAKCVNYTLTQDAYSATVTFTYDLATSPKAYCTVSYTVLGDGEIKVCMDYSPVEGLADMPDFGMIMKIPAACDIVKLYGLGPLENYSDRKMGARLGVSWFRVEDNLTPYARPQECGNRTGVRYAEVMDAKGSGILIKGDKIDFSALPYTPHELENASRPHDLPSVHHTVIRVSAGQLGVGGDDSWGAPVHPEYHLPTDKPLHFEFSFQGRQG